MLEDTTRQWARELQALPEAQLQGVMSRDTSFHVIEVPLMNAPDGPDQDKLKGIPTALRSGEGDLAALRRFARQRLQANPQWQRLLRELATSAPGRSTTAETAPD